MKITPICNTCKGYYLRDPCPTCFPNKAEKNPPKTDKTAQIAELSLDQQLKSNISKIEADKAELEQKLGKDKVNLEQKIIETQNQINLVASKVNDLKIELKNKQSVLEKKYEHLKELEESLSDYKTNFEKIQGENQTLKSEITEKETTLTTLSKSMERSSE